MKRLLTVQPVFRALGGAVAGVVLVLAIWLPFGLGHREPAWLVWLDQAVPRFTPSPTTVLPADAQAEQARIINDVLRRRTWTLAEVNDLAAIVRRGYPVPMRSDRRLQGHEFGQAMVYLSASTALIARLEAGAPMTAEARAAIVNVLLDELDAEFPERRQHAAVALVATGLIRDPLVRARVERLLDDPDAETAEIVALQLSYFDDQRHRSAARASGGTIDGP